MTDFSAYTIEELKDITQKYPYYSAAHLQLAKRLKEENNTEDFQQQINKTILYFNNTLWLNYLLRNQEKEAFATPLKEEEIVADEKLSQILSQQVQGFNKEVTGEEKLFDEPEPLFRTDYFKHQGIDHTSIDAQQETQLGTKVKKFTDWLKDMKKLNTPTPQFNTSDEEEKAIALKALNSLEDKGVVTESMAEVLVLQGKKAQAIDIYEKLSLSNPEKSVYFASKIQFLKENNS